MKPEVATILPEKTKCIFSEEEKELLNLVAEIVVQIIIKETESECDRLCTDQHERPV
jgi:hypothetical protein